MTVFTERRSSGNWPSPQEKRRAQACNSHRQRRRIGGMRRR
ncbi:hypothetical protein X975_14712, partial [Stegodyphus mimosarum]